MQDNPIKYIARTYFQTNKYKNKLANNLSINSFGLTKNYFHKILKLGYFFKIFYKSNPIAMKLIEKIIGTAIVFQHNEEILFNLNSPSS